MPRIEQIDGLTNRLRGRLFVLGDSFSTIRRTGTESAANLNINGRFTASTGNNLWDYFRFGFDVTYQMGLTQNYAREGAMAAQDWRSNAAWSAINPIPSIGSQMTRCFSVSSLMPLLTQPVS